MTTKSVRMVIDYQNIHLTGHDTFAPQGLPKHESLIHPLRFAEQWLQVRNTVIGTQAIKHVGDGILYELASIAVYRGLPSNVENASGYRRNQAQMSEWTRDRRVSVTHRTLKTGWLDGARVTREKGIDVMVAIDVLRSADRRAADVVVLASHDSDMEPALEAAISVEGIAVETAGWEGCRKLRIPGAHVHHTTLDGARFVASRDRKDYT